jgi:hypothetical protein
MFIHSMFATADLADQGRRSTKWRDWSMQVSSKQPGTPASA